MRRKQCRQCPRENGKHIFETMKYPTKKEIERETILSKDFVFFFGIMNNIYRFVLRRTKETENLGQKLLEILDPYKSSTF